MEINPEPQIAEHIDEATQAALDEGIAQLRRGEGIPLEQAREILKERVAEWRKTRDSQIAA